MIMGRVTHHLPEFSFILFFMSHAQSNSMATALVDVVGEMYSTPESQDLFHCVSDEGEI